VYALRVDSTLPTLSLNLDSEDDLMLFWLRSSNPSDCLYSSRTVQGVNTPPGIYYIVVDGFGLAAGSYTLQLECGTPAEATLTPTATPQTVTPTPTVTGEPSPTPTNTRLPSEYWMAYLPLVAKPPIQYYVDCGSDADYVDSTSQLWLADRAYTEGSWGYVGSTLTLPPTPQKVQGTSDGGLYQTQRYGDGGSFVYRFDVPTGTYRVELHFAELYFHRAGARVFSVSIDDLANVVLENLDVYTAAGGEYRALVRTLVIDHNAGSLRIMFIRDWAQGKDVPIINSIAVTRIGD
jgi:hypothetical protein